MSLKILHFSDIHTSSNKGKNIIINRIDSIVGACSSCILPDDDILIVLSGDIAATGKKEEYRIFNDTFNTIVRRIKEECNNSVSIVCVPGNHDCDFGTDADIESREKSINSLTSKKKDPTEDEITTLLSVQTNYKAFESGFSFEKFNNLVNVKHLKFQCGKVAVYMINTSWISQIDENMKERFFPTSQLDDIDNLSEDLVITVFHHPTNWLHPDNCADFQNKIRKFSDLIIVGHEHRYDSMTVSGNDWNCFIREGTELQNPNNVSSDSGFSIYDINNELNLITTYHYFWNGNRYSRRIPNGETTIFTKNARSVPNVYNPNIETKRWADDLELNIQHYRAENIFLSSIFIWPDLDIIDKSFEEADVHNCRVCSDHYNHIVSHSLTLIVGEPTSGKSTIAKVLYKNSNESENCCIYIDASKITTYNFNNLQEIIETEFIKQYKNQYLEEFQQLSKLHKILIVDNFHNLKFTSRKKEEIIRFFCAKFKSVILLSNLDIDCGMLIADCNKINVSDVVMYKIRPMGNRVRKEFINKWFRLGGSSENEDDTIGIKVNEAIKYVDFVLGQYQGILPAYPIQLITILQCQNSAINNNQQISQYGYLYGSLIDASMGKKLSGEEINLYKGVLSELAFSMLVDRSVTDSITDYRTICDRVNKFSKDKFVPLDTNKFIDLMLETKILKITDDSKYKFMYPYIFYYFSGTYIASHLHENIVKDQIDYMCQRLYNEAYGNIMIFVCYFSNNDDVIDQIMLNSFELFNNGELYNFGNENIILQEAFNLIDQFTNSHGIGSDEDIEKNQNTQLQVKDNYEIQDGTVSDDIDTKDTFDDLSEEERKITNLYAALKTMSVLGQIIRCYPGNISGERKVEIITEIHDLGMRTAYEMVNILGMMEHDFIEFFVQREVKTHPNTSVSQISLSVKNTFRCIMAQFVIAMIRNISISFGGELSIMAAEKALSSSISGKLVLFDLKMNCNQISVDDIINAYKSWLKNGNEFAAITLKYLTVNYLEFNRCDSKKRERLCDSFNIDKKKIMIDSNSI